MLKYTNNCCEIFSSFDLQNNLIKEYDYWYLLLRNRNQTLGNCVAITKTHHEQFSDCSQRELSDFSLLVKDVERVLMELFKYDKINYLMLMMVDKHTHFHILPRYREEREFLNMKWVDDGWPKLPAPENDPLPMDILQSIKNSFKKLI